MVSSSDPGSSSHWVQDEVICELANSFLFPLSPSGCLFEDELCARYEFCVNGESHTKIDGEPSNRHTYIHSAARLCIIDLLQFHSAVKKKII